MSIIGVQLILLFFGLFMLYVSFVYWKRKAFTDGTFAVWVLVWVVFLLFSLFPKILEPLLRELFFVRAMDFGMIVAFMVLTYLTIENNVRMKRYEDNLEKLIRRRAVKRVRNGGSNKK